MVKNKFEKISNNTNWVEWCKSLLDLYHTDKKFIVNNRLQTASFLTVRNWILCQKFKGTDKVLKLLLLDAMLSADKKAPGAELLVPWFLCNIEEDKDRPGAQRLSSTDYLLATLKHSNHEQTRNVFNCLFDVVGPLTKIMVKPSVEPDVIIKYRNSFQFPLFLDAQFHKMIGHVEFIEQSNPIVIMIEGAPETVGEINNLLEWNHNKGRPVVLIARSFPEEVSATLATNWLKGSLSVVPLVYGNSLETINLAADLCSITKGELISNQFGDVIASSVLDEDKWGQVDRIEWTSKGLAVFKEVNTSRHMNNLITKMKETENEDLANLLRDRVLSLSNDAVEVWIPKENFQTLGELDSLIKIYNAFVATGAVETKLGLMPKCLVDNAQETAEILRQEILNIGGFLVRTDNEVVA